MKRPKRTFLTPVDGSKALPRIYSRVTDPVGFLTRQKFPDLTVPEIPPSITTGQPKRPDWWDRRHEMRREMEQYQKELAALPDDEIEKMVVEVIRNKEEREEQELFYNLPFARANFDRWCSMDLWTLEEATALALGRDPETVTWSAVRPLVEVSRFAEEYRKLRDLIERGLAANKLTNPIAPSAFLSWAKERNIQTDPVLEELVARGASGQTEAKPERAPPDEATMPSKRSTPIKDAEQKQKYEAVLDAARNGWPRGNYPDFTVIARWLIEQQKNQGLDKGALERILGGTYGPMKRLGLTGLAGRTP